MYLKKILNLSYPGYEGHLLFWINEIGISIPGWSPTHEKMDVRHLGPDEIVYLLISSNQKADVWLFRCNWCTSRQHMANSQARLSCSSRAHAALCFKNVSTCRFLSAGLSVLFILIIYLITWDKLKALFLTVFAAERQAHAQRSRRGRRAGFQSRKATTDGP